MLDQTTALAMKPADRMPREIALGVFWIGDCLLQRHKGKVYHGYNAAFLVAGETASCLVETGHPKDFPVIERHLNALFAREDRFKTIAIYPDVGVRSPQLFRLFDGDFSKLLLVHGRRLGGGPRLPVKVAQRGCPKGERRYFQKVSPIELHKFSFRTEPVNKIMVSAAYYRLPQTIKRFTNQAQYAVTW